MKLLNIYLLIEVSYVFVFVDIVYFFQIYGTNDDLRYIHHYYIHYNVYDDFQNVSDSNDYYMDDHDEYNVVDAVYDDTQNDMGHYVLMHCYSCYDDFVWQHENVQYDENDVI